MRPNNCSENSRKSIQVQKTKLKQTIPKQIPKFILQISKNSENKSKNNFTKAQIYENKNSSNSVPLISQRLQRHSESSLQVLGISLMKIVAHQWVDNGYSILKLNIHKTIRDIERQMIFHKYHILFGFKTSPHELITILNSSLKLIENSLQKQQLTSKYLHMPKNSQKYHNDCVRIHRIVIDHLQKFQISLQFFTILIKMILMLVHYPKLDSIVQNLPPKQIYFIVCDYLDCQIEQNSEGYIFQKGHFIKQMRYHLQFGLIINGSIKSIKSNFKPLFFSGENKPASKSAQNLFLHDLKFTPLLKKPGPRRNTQNSAKKQCPPPLDLKSSFLFLSIDRQKDIQQCESIFELGCEKSTYIEKENIQLNSFDASEGSLKLASVLNTTASVYIKSDKRQIYGFRKSFNVSDIKSREKSEFKCFRCSQKREMSFTSNVVKVQI